MKIAKIPYLNSVLFYHCLETRPEMAATFDLVPLVPRKLSEAVREGTVDAGPVPLVTTFDIKATYESLGELCIATVKKARSILFFSKRPIEEMSGARVGVTSETSTSVRLLKVLFTQLYNVRPAAYVEVEEPNDGFLLIGDEALRHRAGVEGYGHVVDLGEVWHDRTGLPFVFARWMVRRGLPEAQKRTLLDAVEDSLEAGWKQFDAVVEAKLGQLDMKRAEAREYLDGFHFRMGPPEHDAVEKFQKLDRMTRTVEAAGG